MSGYNPIRLIFSSRRGELGKVLAQARAAGNPKRARWPAGRSTCVNRRGWLWQFGCPAALRHLERASRISLPESWRRSGSVEAVADLRLVVLAMPDHDAYSHLTSSMEPVVRPCRVTAQDSHRPDGVTIMTALLDVPDLRDRVMTNTACSASTLCTCGEDLAPSRTALASVARSRWISRRGMLGVSPETAVQRADICCLCLEK